jgi:GT2 family glycosyltransferase
MGAVNRRIAVVMSVYRGVALSHLREAIESIAAQARPADLFVKIDGTVPEPMHEYLSACHKEGQIHYLDYRPQNLGIAYSFNELFSVILKRGYDYIARMDADDIMMPERLDRQYDFMEHNNDIDVVGGFIEEFGDGFDYQQIVAYPLTHEEMFRFFAKRAPLANVTTFFRRSFFEKAGLYPTESPTNEDTLMWMQGFANGCRFANIPEVLVHVRISKAFFQRRGGLEKAWSDFKDRIKVIKTLRYNCISYAYAVAVFIVNISPSWIKKFLYKRFR